MTDIKETRVCVYIDAPNLLEGIKDTMKQRVWLNPYDLATSFLDTKAKEKITGLYYYETPFSGRYSNKRNFAEQQKFFSVLEGLQGENKLRWKKGHYVERPVKIPENYIHSLKNESRISAEGAEFLKTLEWNKPQEKGLDVYMAVDIMRGACTNSYDVAILVSADNDYRHLIEAVKSLKKRMRIAFLDNSYREASELIKRTGEDFIRITRNDIIKFDYRGKKKAQPL